MGMHNSTILNYSESLSTFYYLNVAYMFFKTLLRHVKKPVNPKSTLQLATPGTKVKDNSMNKWKSTEKSCVYVSMCSFRLEHILVFILGRNSRACSNYLSSVC